MTDRFLGGGINVYPDAPLRGCVNDIRMDCEKLVQLCGFTWDQLAACTDQNAHSYGLRSRLERLVSGALPGDRLIFWYSGHGAQIPVRADSGEPDGYLETLVPIDFNWDMEGTWITDKDFYEIFNPIPDGVNLTIVLDSCFSGGMGEAAPRGVTHRAGYPQPDVFSGRLNRAFPIQSLDATVRHRGNVADGKVSTRKLVGGRALLDRVVLIEGCQEDQTCADAYINGRNCGAFTNFFWEQFEANQDASVLELMALTNKTLERTGFEQRCKATGSVEGLSRRFAYRP